MIPNVELDKLIASYGIAEKLTENSDFLKDTLDLVREVVDSPLNYISLLDSERQYVITNSTLKSFPLMAKESICQHTVANKKITIIDDIRFDERTCHLDSRNNEFTFYAGFPLLNSENIAIGALCIMDVQVRDLNENQKNILKLITKGVVEKFDVRRRMIQLIKEINTSFKPSACSDFNCLTGELAHLQTEVLATKENLELEKEKLKISNSNLSQFAHRVAHDIKQPLRSINSFTQLIKAKKSVSEDQEKENEYHNYIKHSIVELNRMIDNLLKIAEFKTDVSPVPISISELINNIEIFFFDIIEANKITIIKPEIDVQVFGYEALLKQVFQNIISNGIKYSDNQKESFVKVDFELLNSSVMVSISDNGIGIAKEDLSSIFNPFNRVSANQEIEGLGIGLDTCKIIIDDMGKDLLVESELGVGTTFSFEIPLR